MRLLLLVLLNVGYALSLNGKQVGENVIALLGIPYALPPVNELRFEKSSPIDFDQTKEYVSWKDRCLNFKLEEGKSEDCLYLNIFLHKKTIEEKKKTNVLLHITNDDVSEQKMADLVTPELSLVVASLRDGILGTLNDAPYAMSDVFSLVKLLQDNADSLFVGNITIWAEDTLAETVASALPGIDIKASIQINGNGATRTRYRDNYGSRAMFEVRTVAECDLPSAEQSIDCLRTKNIDILMGVAHDVWVSFRPFGSPFRSPRQYIPDKSVPTILGLYKHIGKEYLYEPRDFTEGFDYTVFKEFLATLFPESQFKNAALLRRMILHHYVYSTGDKKNTYHLYQQMEKILTDRDYRIPTEMVARHMLENKNKLWLMEYGVDTPLRSCVQSGTPENLDAFCERLLSFFTRFATKDAPTAYSCDPKNPNFPEMSSAKRSYYINLPESGIADWRYNFYLADYEFWINLIPMLDSLELVGYRPPQFEEKKQIDPIEVEDDSQEWHKDEAEKGEKLYAEKQEL